MSPLARAFLQICQEESNTLTIEALRNAALQKMATGEIKTPVTISVNSKSFTSNVSLPADKLLEAASWAIIPDQAAFEALKTAGTSTMAFLFGILVNTRVQGKEPPQSP